MEASQVPCTGLAFSNLDDATSLSKDDLMSGDVVHPNYTAENMYLHFNESQKWYWLPDQSEDELLLFKTMDSGNPISWRV